MNWRAALLLIVGLQPIDAPALSILTYNVAGNNAADWSTNAAQVQAIGRQMLYLKPDVVTFQEIPFNLSHEMTNFVKAYLPGYFLAGNSGTDGFIRSVIASRHPIARSQKWLDGVSLTNFGYPGTFTRDLFEAEIQVPAWSAPLHVFTTHLKASADADSIARRAAEASAISNHLVAAFLPANSNRPYVLTGDLNEDINRPPGGSGQPIQRLVNTRTGLRLTTPLNPVSRQDFTLNIRGTLNVRFDYVLPGELLYSNIATSQVFRTDLLSPVPPPLLQLDDRTASDHLPLLVVFRNPYDVPFELLSIQTSNNLVFLSWETTPDRQYDVESSTDGLNWTLHASNLLATGTNLIWSNLLGSGWEFFRIHRAP